MTKNLSSPPYPYDQRIDMITLPPQEEEGIQQLILSGSKVAAVARVRELTGTGLRLSKDYVNSLAAGLGCR